MTDTKIVGLCGSIWKNSLNRKSLYEAFSLYGNCTFKEATLNLPLYNSDVESLGNPKSTLELSDDIKKVDGSIITCPEYNKGISGVLIWY